MSIRDDLGPLYVSSKRLECTAGGLFGVNCVASALSLFDACRFTDFLYLLQMVSAVGFTVISLVDDGLVWYEAESARRKENIQNAFGVRFLELETDGYYNNSFPPSLVRYALNTFESIFFSKFIASKMLGKSSIRTMTAIILFVSTAWKIGDGKIELIILQFVFSAYFFKDTVFLLMFKERLDRLYGMAYSELITTGVEKKQQVVALLYYCVEYESVKAHYKVRLDSDIYAKYNQELSEKWSQIVSRAKINI